MCLVPLKTTHILLWFNGLCYALFFAPLGESKDHTTWTARTRSRRARCQRPFKTFLKKALSPPKSGNVCEASADQLSLGVLARVTCVPCAAMRSERVTREKKGGVDQGTPKSSILVGFYIINKWGRLYLCAHVTLPEVIVANLVIMVLGLQVAVSSRT